MAQITIEVDDATGLPKAGVTLPPEVQKVADAFIDIGFGKGKTKAETEAKAVIEDLKTKVAGGDPLAAEKLKTAELELSKLREADALRNKNTEEAQKIRDERHAAELKERDDKLTAAQKDIDARTERIRGTIKTEIRAAAIKAGARDESLAELEDLLGGKVDLDKSLNVFVKGSDGKPAVVKVKDAKGVESEQPQTVEGLVTQYITDHPHHKAAGAGRGGRAAGGRSTGDGRTGTGTPAVEAMKDAPTRTNINAAIGEILK